MIIPCHCDKCEGHEFSIDTDRLGFPFHSDMFVVEPECVHGRLWTFPKGPVSMEITCPGCGGFPFEFRDGLPTGRLKVKLNGDRFIRYAHWAELHTEPVADGGVIESLTLAEFKPKGSTDGKRKSGWPKGRSRKQVSKERHAAQKGQGKKEGP